MSKSLATLSDLKKALAEAETIQDVAKIRVQMEVMAKSLAPRYLAPRIKAGKGLVIASRAHGEFWNELANKRGPGGTGDNQYKRNRNKGDDSFVDFIAAGFKHRMDAKRCAALAEINEQDLDLYFEDCQQDGRVPSIGGAYKLWQEVQPDEDRPAPERIENNLVVGDFRDVDLPPDSVDLIFTDPPYNEAGIPLYGDLSAMAADWLMPGGFCMAYAGQWALPRIIELLGESLEYFWTGAIFHSGDKTYIRKHHLRNAWKPILMFYKPPLDVKWKSIEDLVSGGQEKDSGHPWQQAVAEASYFIEAACPEGGIVVDPMCGSGTTLIAASELDRRYLGIEISAEYVEIARSRLSDA